MPDPDEEIKRVVGRKLNGYRADTFIAHDGERCGSCHQQPVAERGSLAYEHGLCVECATKKQRNGDWRTPPIF